MVGIERTSTKQMSREEWLSLRKKSIGGSDAAGVIGLSRYSSPYSVWADKTGLLPDKPDTEAMRIGRDLEEYVAKRFSEETGKKVRRENAILYNSLYPFAHADVDRMVIGENAGLECKTTSTLDLRQFRGAEFPEKYYVQCVHYMAVTGADRWYLAVLVFGRGFFCYTLERDQAEIDALMHSEEAFWRYVETNTPPPTDGSDATTDSLTVIYAQSEGQSADLSLRESLLDEYVSLKEKKKLIDERTSEIENIIKEELGACEVGFCGAYEVRWKSQQRRTFQPKALADEHPEIDLERYYTVQSSRPFKVALKKE